MIKIQNMINTTQNKDYINYIYEQYKNKEHTICECNFFYD